MEDKIMNSFALKSGEQAKDETLFLSANIVRMNGYRIKSIHSESDENITNIELFEGNIQVVLENYEWLKIYFNSEKVPFGKQVEIYEQILAELDMLENETKGQLEEN